MKLTLAEPKILKEGVSIIAELVTEARFRINKDLLELVAMDPANVALTIFRMPSSVFAEYNVKEDAVLAINLNNLKQVLRRAKPNDVLTLEQEESKLKITLKEKNTRTFYLPLLDLEEKQQRVPNLTPKVSVEMNSTVLNEAIEDVDIVSESVTFLADGENISIMASGDLTKAEVNLENQAKVTNTADEPQKAKYSIEYLKKMIQGSKLSDKVTVKFSKDYPITIEYKQTDKHLLSFILAPRVDND